MENNKPTYETKKDQNGKTYNVAVYDLITADEIFLHVESGNIGKLHKRQNGVIHIELVDGRIYFAPEREFTQLLTLNY